MVVFFKHSNIIFVTEMNHYPNNEEISKLSWLFGNAEYIDSDSVEGFFIGPRKEMITPWSTNAVEITQNAGIHGISRIEEFFKYNPEDPFDPMLQMKYENLNQFVFKTDRVAEPIIYVKNIAEYNKKEGLALSEDEINYLESLSKSLGRELTDSEVFGFSQINSEHCRHKIFNGTFIIDGKEMPSSLFGLIKKTSKENPNSIVSAYKDNVAFIKGPIIEQFAPKTHETSDYFEVSDIETVLSLKAETHNFPTTVEPFNGAATGSGGEIRDRLGGGKGSLPLAGTAVYMTSYPRNGNNNWEKNIPARHWLYQSPEDILIKASNGASDFGNKFGQPLICGSVLTFEHFSKNRKFGFDKVIMLAGGVGFTKSKDSIKALPEKGDVIVLLGGDNYRIGMGGGAVSSVNTGEYQNLIELNAVQRSNPEMQKRVANTIRSLVEMTDNPIISIHDHGAGGHLNSFSELVENNGGIIYLDQLPVGDPTLSDKEIIGNESQERMGLIIKKEHISLLRKIAERERSPFYIVGEVTDDMRFVVVDNRDGEKPIDLSLNDFFGNPPKTILTDKSIEIITPEDKKLNIEDFDIDDIEEHLMQVLSMESVACKDWLTNKVDRSVGGKTAMQQCTGVFHLPLNNLGAMALDYKGKKGIATSIGHAPVAALLDPAEASRLAVCEALTNIVWAPINDGIKGVSLSANWMWPAKVEGENARLYKAAEAISNFCIDLGINIPTGKDSLSMTQKYPDGENVFSPGTVIVSAAGEVTDINKIISPVIKNISKSKLLYIDFSKSEFNLGGTVFAQTQNSLGNETATTGDAEYVKNTFNAIQELINKNLIIAGHDVSAGGLITTLLEMTFSTVNLGINADFNVFENENIYNIAFSEKPAVVIQITDLNEVAKILSSYGVEFYNFGDVTKNDLLTINYNDDDIEFQISDLRDIWNRPSFLFNSKQIAGDLAIQRYFNMFDQPLIYKYGKDFTGKAKDYGIDLNRKSFSGIKAAIIREKGCQCDREMAYVLYLAGFDVKDVHVTDLMSGRETLEDINMIVFVGGFSHSDVLGSAKGWAAAFKYNDRARTTLENFYKRKDTLSLGVCNGCQLMMQLELITPELEIKPQMLHNDSHKFESAFINVDIHENNSVMLSSLSGYRLGVWIAHGEGKFDLALDKSNYNIPATYSYSEYPGNPNGSDYEAAALCSADGRHLAIMPHLERSFLAWQWPYRTRENDEITPWILAFVNARKWIEERVEK
ncbi:MAG: phosphoribosylformylglycinamidine synthase [Bacteroidales bacterium]|jgi:phosphoribosylformylglycinamidine synthase|nr:phosphoribosylformylglycinamidine synthase [Bacteroidales bacterium]